MNCLWLKIARIYCRKIFLFYSIITVLLSARFQTKQVYQGNYAFITSQTKIEIEKSITCDAADMDEKFHTFSKAIGVQTNSVYKDIFSEL